MSESTRPLVVEVEELAGRPCLRPVGEVDIASTPALQEAIAAQFDSGKSCLVIDMNSLTYLDSTGLGCIAAARRRAREAGGDILVVCSATRILRLLSITGMDLVFRVVRTLDDARALLGEGCSDE